MGIKKIPPVPAKRPEMRIIVAIVTVPRVVVRSSDVSGIEGAEEFTFSFNGTRYVIDLTEDEIATVLEDNAYLIDNARSRKSTTGGSVSDDVDVIRSWGRANGFDVADRGRLSNTVREAFVAAGSPGV